MASVTGGCDLDHNDRSDDDMASQTHHLRLGLDFEDSTS